LRSYSSAPADAEMLATADHPRNGLEVAGPSRPTVRRTAAVAPDGSSGFRPGFDTDPPPDKP